MGTNGTHTCILPSGNKNSPTATSTSLKADAPSASHGPLQHQQSTSTTPHFWTQAAPSEPPETTKTSSSEYSETHCRYIKGYTYPMGLSSYSRPYEPQLRPHIMAYNCNITDATSEKADGRLTRTTPHRSDRAPRPPSASTRPYQRPCATDTIRDPRPTSTSTGL